MYRCEKSVRFEASHQLVHHDGICSRLHGHSYRAVIVCEGEELSTVSYKRNMLVDYGDIGETAKPIVDLFLDHRHLNDTLGTDMPTSEFIAKWLYDKLKPLLPLLVEVRIAETCTASCVYRPTLERDV